MAALHWQHHTEGNYATVQDSVASTHCIMIGKAHGQHRAPLDYLEPNLEDFKRLESDGGGHDGVYGARAEWRELHRTGDGEGAERGEALTGKGGHVSPVGRGRVGRGAGEQLNVLQPQKVLLPLLHDLLVAIDAEVVQGGRGVLWHESEGLHHSLSTSKQAWATQPRRLNNSMPLQTDQCPGLGLQSSPLCTTTAVQTTSSSTASHRDLHRN